MNVYMTIQGDMWDQIAFKVYWDEKYQRELLLENPEYIKTIIFPAGIPIFCPQIISPKPNHLPEWKGGRP